MEKLYTANNNKKRPGADCGSDHQLLKIQFRLKLKKTGKNTRPARYDLNQILCKFTVGVMNGFKGLDLVKSVPEELWTEVHNTDLWGRWHTKPSPKKEEQEGKAVI